MVCQKIPALVQVDRERGEFRLFRCEERELLYPVALCEAGKGVILLSDPETATVYRWSQDKLKPFITSDLVRPTGLAALPGAGRVYVVDTGDQSLKIFDYEGRLWRTLRADDSGRPLFNYPTFATATRHGEVLVNDGLNFEIKRLDSEGGLLGSFGREGEGPGSFSRPKGVAVDSDDHIYVVDNLFDNVQIFDTSGRVLLALGSAGHDAGQFWSPAGLDISDDTIYVADTYNHRVQILHYLGDGE
jgi:DNA-binding beta-propeller fold protein YncE